MKTKIKSALPAAVICLAAVLIELLLSNFVWFSFVAGKNGTSDYVPQLTEAYVNETDNSFALSEIDFPVHSVSYTVKTVDAGAESRLLTAAYYVADENSTASAALVQRERIAVGPQERRVTAYISSYGKASYIDITFEDVKTELAITDIVVNPSYKAGFNMLRFALIFTAIVFIYVLKKNKSAKKFIADLTYTQAGIVSVTVCVAAAAVVWIMSASGESGNCIAYPLEYGVESYSPYIQQFDAFMKGQLHFDVQPSAELLALENPYSPDERYGLQFLYDRAFYGGKYYSYFGIAPILTVYFPFYWLTGFLPVDSTVMGVFSVVTAIFLPLAVVEWAGFRKKSCPWFAAVCAVGAYFASMALLIQRGVAPFYYVASIAGMAFVSAFLFFIVTAISCKKTAPRIIFMIIAGVCYSFAFMSRVNSVLPVTFAIIAFIIIYLIKSIKSKSLPRYFGEMAALGAPVAAALAFTMWYNNARFGSPLQFGTAYQLTVANTAYYEFYAGGIIPTLFHYFIQPLKAGDMFPFVQLEYFRLAGYGRSLYIDSNFGVFAVPFMLSLLLSPYIFKSKNISRNGKIMLGVSFVSFAVTAYADMCMGGVIFRYTSDILLFAAFVSAAILLEIKDIAAEKYGSNSASAVKKGVILLTAATVIVSAAVAVSINGNLARYSPDMHLALRDFFVFWS